MPRNLTLNFGRPGMAKRLKVEVATEDELLDFANEVRTAAGGEILDALLPGYALDGANCLIANNVNFNSEVLPVNHRDYEIWPSGAWRWAMIPSDPRVARKLAKALNLELYGGRRRSASVILPEAIGNAARAFDEHKAFTKLSGRPR